MDSSGISCRTIVHIGRQMDDIEFDTNNNIYVIGRNYTTICRTKLN